MPKIKTPVVSISTTPGIGAQIATGAIAAGRRAELPALTREQMARMTPGQIKAYNIKRARVNMSVNRTTQRRARKAAKADQALELQKSQMMHTTIRQGLAELAGIGTEAVGAGAITRAQEASNAVAQNVSGGMVPHTEDRPDNWTEDGPVAVVYSKKGRRED